MKVRSIRLGNLPLKNNIFLAPMAGFTDYSFRSAVKDFGYGLCFTELVSSKGLFFGGEKTKDLLKTFHGEQVAAQIFGSDPFYMRKACESEDLSQFKIVDINMGCPVPKVFKNGDGSALLSDIKKAEGIVKECVKSGKIITVKIRTGLKEGDDFSTDFCKMAEGAGAKLVTIHGRVRDNYYSGEPDFASIERAKKAVQIPIVANGGIFTVKDADEMMEKTGADGVMLARGAIKNPFLIQELLGLPKTENLPHFALRHLAILKEEKGTFRAAVEFRKFINSYFSDFSGVKSVRARLMKCNTAEEIEGIIRTL